jgi:20S proteasome alpha/beta subunit
VGIDGAGLYTISGMDYTNHTDMGYTTIGSGTESARLTFIRRKYDEYAEHREGVFTVLEAKAQAEERQGVGVETDLLSISRDGIREYDENEMQTLRQKLKRIDAEEQNARQSVMDEWENSDG